MHVDRLFRRWPAQMYKARGQYCPDSTYYTNSTDRTPWGERLK